MDTHTTPKTCTCAAVIMGNSWHTPGCDLFEDAEPAPSPSPGQIVRQSFVVTESEHPVDECPDCAAEAESAKTTAQVTGSTGATSIRDGRALREPYYHAATVKRPHPVPGL